MSQKPPAKLATISFVREHGPTPPEVLVSYLRAESRSAGMDETRLNTLITRNPLLIVRPDGTVDHLVHLLDGAILTQRVLTSLHNRRELWAGPALTPIVELLNDRPMRLTDGGIVTLSKRYSTVLTSEALWVPELGRSDLLGVRIDGGRLSLVRVDESVLPDDDRADELAALLCRHYAAAHRSRRAWGCPPILSFPCPIVPETIATALLEVPDLLADPLLPLDEILPKPAPLCCSESSPQDIPWPEPDDYPDLDPDYPWDEYAFGEYPPASSRSAVWGPSCEDVDSSTWRV